MPYTVQLSYKPAGQTAGADDRSIFITVIKGDHEVTTNITVSEWNLVMNREPEYMLKARLRCMYPSLQRTDVELVTQELTDDAETKADWRKWAGEIDPEVPNFLDELLDSKDAAKEPVVSTVPAAFSGEVTCSLWCELQRKRSRKYILLI